MSAEKFDLLRLKHAASYMNVSLTTLWRLAERDPTFPTKIRISPRLCYYRKSDLDLWISEKADCL